MRNVLAMAWSSDGLFAFVTRAAWRGPKNVVHVVDATNGFSPVAKMDLDGDPSRERACLVFVGEKLLAHVGGAIVMWNPRTGEELDRDTIPGWIFALYSDGSVGLNANGLQIVSLLGGPRFSLRFEADYLTPIAAPSDDWAVWSNDEIRRVAPAGNVRWSVVHESRPNAFGAGAATVIVGSNAERKVWLFDSETGEPRAELSTGAHVAVCGVLPEGTPWFMEHRGRLVFLSPAGAIVREVRVDDVLCITAVPSPDASRIAVAADLLDLRSCVKIASTTTGANEWDSKVRAKTAPAARAKGGPTLTAKDGQLWRKGSKTAIGTYEGEALLAIAKDGKAAIVADATSVRVLDVATGQETIRHSNAKLEEDTICEVVDKVLFDAEGRPCVKVERHTFIVAPEGFVSGKVAKPRTRKAR